MVTGLQRTALVGAVGIGLLAAPLTVPATGAIVGKGSTIHTIAGSRAGFGGDGGPARRALLNQPRDTAVARDGTIYVADTYNNRIRKISPNGTIHTVVGSGSSAYNGDHIRARRASLDWPHDVAVSHGVLYIADSAHQRIRKVNRRGIITTIVGTGQKGSSGDGGPATRARIHNPKGVVIHDGYLYFASLENKVRRVNLETGIIRTIAGTGRAAYTGDGGPARKATLHSPQRLVIDSHGNIYVADSDNNVVRRIDARTHVITTVAGTGREGSSGDGGRAKRARLDHPRGLAMSGDSILYVADSNSHRVRRVDLRSGTITRVAGSSRGYSGDGGPAGRAQLYQPRGLSVMPGGALLVADTFNSRIRVIRPRR